MLLLLYTLPIFMLAEWKLGLDQFISGLCTLYLYYHDIYVAGRKQIGELTCLLARDIDD